MQNAMTWNFFISGKWTGSPYPMLLLTGRSNYGYRTGRAQTYMPALNMSGLSHVSLAKKKRNGPRRVLAF